MTTVASPDVAATSDDRVRALGNVSGAVEIDASLAGVYTLTVIGNTVLSFTGWPARFHRKLVLYLFMDSIGGWAVTYAAGVSFGNAGDPTAPDASTYDVYVFTSPDEGVHVPAIIAGVGFTA